MIVERGYQYVIAAKLKKLPKNIQHKLFDETNYQASQLDNQFAWVSDIEYGEQRLIVSYKTKRARKDKKDREAVLEKLNKLMGSGTSCKKLVNNRAIKQYVDIKGGDAKLNTDAIEKAEAVGWLTRSGDQSHRRISSRCAGKVQSFVGHRGIIQGQQAYPADATNIPLETRTHTCTHSTLLYGF